MPGAVCSLPQTEPETEEHRAGKLLLARWLRERVPNAEVTVEAHLPVTGQRADLLLEIPPSATTGLSVGSPIRAGCTGKLPKSRRIAVEFQCANLSAREWRRRHRLYREGGIEDLWILGGSRFRSERANETSGQGGEAAMATSPDRVLHTGELERALMSDGMPLLFLDPMGTILPEGTLARFRPAEATQLLHPEGRLSKGRLLDLDFPWKLLELQSQNIVAPTIASKVVPEPLAPQPGAIPSSEHLWRWLEQRYRVTPQTLSPLFGVPAPGQDLIPCEPRLWQAAVYYRFVHQRVGMGWWLTEVETWARAYLPLSQPVMLRKLRSTLRIAQDFFAAAGFLTLPVGNSRSNARVTADLDTLTSPPDREEAIRIARYRRTIDR